MSSATTSDFQNVEFKSITGQINVDEAKGIVECFVSGVGNKDSVGDIVLPGAFSESLKRRKPRVVWGHDWNHPIGKVLEIYEVSSSDMRLPAKMKSAGIGGLFARVQFNLKSEKGREAFANIAFYGEDQEWSIGYKTLDAIYDNQRQANLLREVELYEVSPVLHGANQLTGTISIKSDQQVVDDDLYTSENDYMYVFEEDEELSIYTDDELVDLFSRRDEKSLTQWFKEDWVDISRPKKGGGFEPCGRSDAEDGKYPKCVPASKASKMTPEEIESAVRRKRRAESTEERQGKKPINVSTDAKSFDTTDTSFKSAIPTDPELYARVKAEAKKKFDVYPSAYANAWLVRTYKKRGGGYRESKKDFDFTELYNKTDENENSLTSFRSSKWKMFDRAFAARIKKEHPEIWATGGNIKGNDQYRILTKIAEQNGTANTTDQINALKLREAWVARHADNFKLAGVVAQIKWLAVGSRGEDYMKNVIREAIKKKEEKSFNLTDLETAGFKEIEDGDEEFMYGQYLDPVAEKSCGCGGSEHGSAPRMPMMPLGDTSDNPDKDTDSLLADFFEQMARAYAMRSIRKRQRVGQRFLKDEKEDVNPCWEGYVMAGMKPGKNGRMVPNCVPAKEVGKQSPKQLIENFEQKAGRVISAGNLEKLQQAMDLLREIIAAGGRAEIEMKLDSSFISSEPDDLFALKSFIDPVLDFHGANAEVLEDGIEIKDIGLLNVGFSAALVNAVKNFNQFT